MMRAASVGSRSLGPSGRGAGRAGEQARCGLWLDGNPNPLHKLCKALLSPRATKPFWIRKPQNLKVLRPEARRSQLVSDMHRERKARGVL